MENLLFISNISYKIDAFSKAAILAAHNRSLGFNYASNWSAASPEQISTDESAYKITIHNVAISRSPFSPSNLKALNQIKMILKTEKIDYIHCNTPVGGVIGRLLNRNVKKVIYEAHGFHFYKGAPLKNWLLYYPVEKILASRSDAIITINRDDYEFAKKHLKSKIYYVPGVGIELEQWSAYKDIREEVGLRPDDFVILIVGRLEKNKNCGTVIDAVRKVPGVKLVFCGDGEDRLILEEKAKELGNRAIFLGNRSDMSDVYHMADCFVLASFREGLSRSIMEAMVCGLPCIVSDIRGNRDLIDKDFLFNPNDVDALADKIMKVNKSQKQRNMMKARNLKKIKEFNFDKVVEELSKIYEEVYELEKT